MIVKYLILVECEVGEPKGMTPIEIVEWGRKSIEHFVTIPPSAVIPSYYLESVMPLLGVPPDVQRSNGCIGCPSFPYVLCRICQEHNRKVEVQ